MKPFNCDKCGLCCKMTHGTPLDRGDGNCKHLDIDKGLCTIYENRPPICRVDEMYKRKNLKGVSWEQYKEMSHKACDVIKNAFKG